jgi:hypothetical protein
MLGQVGVSVLVIRITAFSAFRPVRNSDAGYKYAVSLPYLKSLLYINRGGIHHLHFHLSHTSKHIFPITPLRINT